MGIRHEIIELIALRLAHKDSGQLAESALMTNEAEQPRHEVWRMFNRIAGRYDFLNHFLSFNRDVAWRNQVVKMLPPNNNLHVLDLATGTADQLLALNQSGRIAKGVGIDPAEKMLEIGREKISKRGLEDKFELQPGSAEKISATDGKFDAVTMAFGIRNVTDVSQTLGEIYRVLKPGGRALILEFSLPKYTFMKWGYLFYLRHILPHIGGMLSGDSAAYRYLNVTIESFPYGDSFCELMRQSGFDKVSFHPMTLGVATIYQGEK